MPTAKSYINCETVGSPWEQNKKMYIYILKNGAQKKVRWYTDQEYAKMYGLPDPGNGFDAHKAFGFDNEKDAIYLVGEDYPSTSQYMRDLNAQTRLFMYNEIFGWFMKPEKAAGWSISMCGLIKLCWCDVSKDNQMYDDIKVRKICADKRKEYLKNRSV